VLRSDATATVRRDEHRDPCQGADEAWAAPCGEEHGRDDRELGGQPSRLQRRVIEFVER